MVPITMTIQMVCCSCLYGRVAMVKLELTLTSKLSTVSILGWGITGAKVPMKCETLLGFDSREKGYRGYPGWYTAVYSGIPPEGIFGGRGGNYNIVFEQQEATDWVPVVYCGVWYTTLGTCSNPG